MWDFAPPEEECGRPTSAPSATIAEYRPNRMALGCSNGMIQEKISDNAKKSRLEKLLKRRGEFVDTQEGSAKKLMASIVGGDDSDCERKSRTESKRVEPLIPEAHTVVASLGLSKTQKKRQKQKLKDLQKKLLN